jgi:hypothetical protein
MLPYPYITPMGMLGPAVNASDTQSSRLGDESDLRKTWGVWCRWPRSRIKHGYYPVQGKRPAINIRSAVLAKSFLRDASARTQRANSAIVSLCLGEGFGMQILVLFWLC